MENVEHKIGCMHDQDKKESEDQNRTESTVDAPFLFGDMTGKMSTVNLSTSAKLQGSVIDYNEKAVNQFLGIPYAEPPVGKLRFQDPVPLKLWSGTRQATEYGKTRLLQHVSCQNKTRVSSTKGPM